MDLSATGAPVIQPMSTSRPFTGSLAGWSQVHSL